MSPPAHRKVTRHTLAAHKRRGSTRNQAQRATRIYYRSTVNASPLELPHRSKLHGSLGHDKLLHLCLVASALLADGRLQHADHDAVEAQHEGDQ